MKNIHTLNAYYAALGQVVPDIASRVELYASMGLGPESTYIGTAEQNNRLLVELKRKDGTL